MDYVYCYLSYFGHVLGRATMKGYWERIEQLGRDDNPHRAGFLQFVGVADTDAEAMRLYKSAAEYFYHRCLHVYGGFADPPGYRTEATLRAQAGSAVREAARRAAHGLPSWEEMVEMGYVIVGSPDTVREQLDHVARDLRVGHLMILLQFGNMHPELVRYNTELFAEKVAPDLRAVWEGYEDPWWPAACSGPGPGAGSGATPA
jgi:alkanesulfonate monooxygenase SsuD/methylene tetrahydromethanopterin reductase-like flavin-dependent oxidoreductase (luciferase family)